MNLKWIKNYICVVFMLFYPFLSLCDVVSLQASNFETVIKENRIVLVNFFAPWCRFSIQLAPIFEEASNATSKVITESNAVVFGSVNCVKNGDLSFKYHIRKYPTLKLFRDGKLVKQEYRGERSVQSIVDYILDQLRGGIKEFHSLKELKDLPKHRRTVIGYFEARDSASFGTFEKMANALQDECDFYAGFGEATLSERTTGDNVVFRHHTEYHPESVYMGSLTNYDLLLKWTREKCVPLVKEITFYNAEELTEEGLTFFVLFHKREDTESLDIFQKEVAKLASFKSNFNFLSADCEGFAHPLFHMGKSASDCPVVIIDSFRHMYLFPSFEQITEPDKLKRFLTDFQNGKLHREFHYGPDPIPKKSSKSVSEVKIKEKESSMSVSLLKISSSVQTKEDEKAKKVKKPENSKEVIFITRESVFKNLKPSVHRYSFDRRDEL